MPVSVVIPCFNEEATLGYLANTLDSFAESVRDDYQVSFVFVDDGSSDKTWERLNELFGQRADCKVVQHPQNRGIAAATLTGIQHSPSEIVCAIDADGTFDPHQLKEMIPMLKPGVDAVTASCFLEQGHVMNVPGWRMALSKGASLMYRMVLHNKLSHYTSCFRVYRKSAVSPAQPAQRTLRRHHRNPQSARPPGLGHRRVSSGPRGAAARPVEDEDPQDDRRAPAADQAPGG